MASGHHLLHSCKFGRNTVPRYVFHVLTSYSSWTSRSRRQVYSTQKRLQHVETAAATTHDLPTPQQLLDLPRSCPGCGAFTQAVSPDQPGFYSTNRKSVKAFIAPHEQNSRHGKSEESEAFDRIVGSADTTLLSRLGLENAKFEKKSQPASTTIPPPLCNRCHHLTHHNTGVSVMHPTLRDISDIIAETPHRYNHIYHVLDAADFPLSLIPSLQRHISFSPLRSQNRRAKTSHFQSGWRADMSFIITRSDLLAPKKEQVDKLMPYLVQVLRDALGKSAENVRLGNVRCVSAKRGWWTRQVKEDIWNRGGGGWMVGKVNVGKSNLFETIFPKGRNEDVSIQPLRDVAERALLKEPAGEALDQRYRLEFESQIGQDSKAHEKEAIKMGPLGDSPLPPAPPETAFPVLPLVSSLPGTTASPIRIPFGGGKGELIDLPGLSRGDLEEFVKDEHKMDLVMHHRIKPEQFTIKPGQSLLVGGLIRITPVTEVTVLACPFVPLKCHVTSTEKAIAIHTQEAESGIATIARPGVGSRMGRAGTFSLKWDVTKQRAGPLTNKAAAGLSPDILPFVVLSADILIEGCGWVELVAQVRKKDMEEIGAAANFFDSKPYPRVEIASPDGRHIGVRRPMGGWLLNGIKPESRRAPARPRRSMRGAKKKMKRARRERSLSSGIQESRCDEAKG